MKAEMENEVTRGHGLAVQGLLDALSLMENGVVPRYKPDGRGEIVQQTAEVGGQKPRGLTFADAFGDRDSSN